LPLTLWKFDRWIRRQLLFFCNLLQYGQQNGPRFSPWASRIWTFKFRVFTNPRLHCMQVNFIFLVRPLLSVEERAKNEWCVNIVHIFKCSIQYKQWNKDKDFHIKNDGVCYNVQLIKLQLFFIRINSNKFSQAFSPFSRIKNQR